MGDNKDVNFEWDKNTPEIDFFGETKTEESVVETVIKDDLEIPLKKDEKTGIEKPKKEEKPEENINFFENTEKVEKTKTEEEEEETEEEEEEETDPTKKKEKN